MQINLPSLSYFIIFLLTISCAQQNEQQKTSQKNTDHPTQENLLSEDLIDYFISTSETIPERVDSTDLNRLVTIGVSSGDRNQVFGQIRYSEILDSQTLAVFDHLGSELRLFDIQTGEYITDIGGAGRGPGEFVQVSGMYSVDNKLYVSDRLNKVEMFNLADPEDVHNQSMRVDVSPIGVCRLGDQTFIAGVDRATQKTVHQYNSHSSEKIRSFHDSYSTTSPAVEIVLSQNRIVCNQASGNLVLISPFLPYIHGYNSSGELQWTSELRDFNPRLARDDLDEAGRPGIVTGLHRDGVSDVYSRLISSKDTETVLIQMNRINRENGESAGGQILTFSINSHTGEGSLISRSMPFIQAFNNEYIVSMRTNPFPQIYINQNNEILK